MGRLLMVVEPPPLSAVRIIETQGPHFPLRVPFGEFTTNGCELANSNAG